MDQENKRYKEETNSFLNSNVKKETHTQCDTSSQTLSSHKKVTKDLSNIKIKK